MLVAGASCDATLQLLLAREREVFHFLGPSMPDGGGSRAHFLALASYGLQHPVAMEYTAESLATLRDMVSLRLKREAPTYSLRRTAKKVREQGLVTRRHGDGVARRGAIRWPVTVLDVLRTPPGGYLDAVHRWASSVIKLMAGVNQTL